MWQPVIECADYIRRLWGEGDLPDTALVLGSGLNGVANALEEAQHLPYGNLPNFPQATVSGHVGTLHMGRLGGRKVFCLQGRAHAYEGHSPEAVGFATRLMVELGVKNLILTNAAGSLDAHIAPGELMCIDDHINFSGVNPLVGPNDEARGPRFVDVSDAWSAELRQQLDTAAAEIDMPLHHGVYIMVKGPNFETPAEIRAFRTMGATAVGMSTVPECLVAHHAGLRVLGISSITNLAAGMTGEKLTHHETMAVGAIAAQKLEKLLCHFIPQLV